MKKTVLAGLLGGLALFVWGSFSHMALGLGEVGIRSIPVAQEPAVLAAMKSAMNERALYFLPGIDMSREPTAQEQEAWMGRYLAGPAGLIAYNPRPADRLTARSFWPTQLGTELLGDVLAALFAALVILSVPASVGYLRRALLGACLGLVMGFDVDVSYWNWYAFPTPYMLVQLLDHTVGWFLAGLVIAAFGRRSPA